MCFSRNFLFSVYLRESHLVSVHRCPVIADVIGARRSSSSCCSCCHVALFSLSHLMTVCLDNICHWRPLALIVSLVETEDWLQRAQKTLRTVVDDPCDDIGNCVLMMSKFRVGVCWLWWWVFFFSLLRGGAFCSIIYALYKHLIIPGAVTWRNIQQS